MHHSIARIQLLFSLHTFGVCLLFTACSFLIFFFCSFFSFSPFVITHLFDAIVLFFMKRNSQVLKAIVAHTHTQSFNAIIKIYRQIREHCRNRWCLFIILLILWFVAVVGAVVDAIVVVTIVAI